MKNIFLVIISFFMFLPVLADEAKILPSVTGKVQNVEYVDVDEGFAQTKQAVEVKILSGDLKGETVILDNVLTGNPSTYSR